MKPFNHSAYWRNRALLLSIGCWTVLVPVIYYGWPDRAWNGWPVWVQIFLLVMFVGATLGLIAAFWLHIEARAFERLQAAHRGGKVLVRWRLSAEDWERFKALSAREGVLPPDAIAPSEGFECYATADAAQVGPMFLNAMGLGVVSSVTYLGGPPGAIRVDAIAAAGATVQRVVRQTIVVPVGSDHRAARFLHAAWLWRQRLIGSTAARSSAGRLFAWAIAALLLGVVLCTWSIWQFDLLEAVSERGEPPHWMLILGTILIVLGGPLSLRFRMDWLRQARASRGEPIAGWQVEADAWRAFLDAEAAANAKPNANYNLIELAALAPPLSVEACGETLKIGGQVIDIGALAAKGVKSVVWIDGQCPAIELTGVYHARVGAFSRLAKPSGDWGEFVLRFPVPPAAQDAGRRVVEDWRRRFPAAR